MEFISGAINQTEKGDRSHRGQGPKIKGMGSDHPTGQDPQDGVLQKMIYLIRRKKLRGLDKKVGLGGKIKNDQAVKD
jgi:hypothetical protein